MRNVITRRAVGWLAAFALVSPLPSSASPRSAAVLLAQASPSDSKQPASPSAKPPAPATPSTPAPTTSTPTTSTPTSPAPGTAPGGTTPPAPAPAPTTPGGQSPAPAPTSKTPGAPPAPQKLAPDTTPDKTEVEPNGSPGVPQNATTETVTVPARPIVMVHGQSSYDDAFKSIKGSVEAVKAAMTKAGLKAAGHPITIFSEPDKDGFKYEAAIPIAAKPDKVDLPAGVTIGESPSGKAIKFQHRGGYDDIDSTYDVITTYLDAKGLQVDNPYIEEYLTDLTSSDDPNLQVDIYVFMK